MAKAELAFEKAYYTQREFLGQSAWKALKAKAVATDSELRKTCGIAASGRVEPMPPDAAACYEREISKAANAWNESIWGPAFDEAHRPIERHLALQQKLVDFGLAKGPADGIYGDGTRDAIDRWQEMRGQKATGFLTDLQADDLMTRAAVPIPPPASAITFQDLFSHDMLGITVLYLESKIGPAKRVESTSGIEARTYLIGGCEITAYSGKGTITGYGMDVSRACNVNLSEIANLPTSPTHRATFGDFEMAMSGNFRASCLQGCGNATDPVVIWSAEGSHSQDFIDVELQVTLATQPVLDAADKWEVAMKASGGGDYVESGSGACDGKHDTAAESAFHDIEFTHLYVGNGHSPDEAAIERGCKPA